MILHIHLVNSDIRLHSINSTWNHLLKDPRTIDIQSRERPKNGLKNCQKMYVQSMAKNDIISNELSESGEIS